MYTCLNHLSAAACLISGTGRENSILTTSGKKKWLEHYCTVFKTVELNVTFYRLPLVKTFERWHAETSPDFVFSLKGSRYITHIKRLLDPEEPLDLFFERALHLKESIVTKH